MCCQKYNKQTENCLKPFWVISGLIFSIIILILSIISLSPFHDSLDFISIAINWNNMAIQDIYVIDSNRDCPDGSDHVQKDTNMFLYNWNGMSSGCDCTDLSASNPTLNVLKSECTTAQLATCSKVNSQSERDMHKWDLSNNGTGIKLCLTRIPYYNFLAAYLKENQCRVSTDIMCGGPITSSKFCVPQGSKCPITSIQVGNDSIHQEQIGNTGLFVSRNENLNYYPLSEFRLEQAAGVCTNTFSKNYYSTIPDYPLEKDEKKICQQTDPRWIIINQLTKKQFFSINSLSELFNNKGQQLLSNQGADFVAFQRRYVQWDITCRENNSFDDLIQQIINLINVIKNHQSVMYLSIFDIALHALFLIILIFQSCKFNKDTKCCCIPCKCLCCCFPCRCNSPTCCRRWWLKKSQKNHWTDYCRIFDPITIWIIFLKFGVEIVELALICVSIAKIGTISSFADEYSNKQCSDQLTQTALAQLGTNFANKVVSLSGALIAVIAIFLIEQLLLLLIFWKKAVDLRRKVLKSKLQQLNRQELPEDQTYGTLPDIDAEMVPYNKPNDQPHIQQLNTSYQQNQQFIQQNNNLQQPIYNLPVNPTGFTVQQQQFYGQQQQVFQPQQMYQYPQQQPQMMQQNQINNYQQKNNQFFH